MLPEAGESVLKAQKASDKPLAIVLAGHNGSGKSTMWYERGLADKFQMPLINADRMMLSILPESAAGQDMPPWAVAIRDLDPSWMEVAQKGVVAFVERAMDHKVPFAMETVFSHWRERADGKRESKIDLIRQMQDSGYFVLLVFVGLANVQLSITRVHTRVARGGHHVDENKLRERFPRTQIAIRHALRVADAAILADNSGEMEEAFTVYRVQLGDKEVFDRRRGGDKKSTAALQWLNVICPE